MRGKRSIRVQAGARARSNGQVFENMIQAQARLEQISAIKIPDGCRRINTPKGLKLIPVFTPFDFVILKDSKAITLDAKTVNESTFTYSQILPHQLKSLHVCSKNAFKSGYLIWFRTDDLVSFLPSDLLQTVRPKKSLQPHDGLILGSGSHFQLSKLFKTQTLHIVDLNLKPVLPME